MSSQSKASILNIFEDSERVINVLNWENHITQNPGTYKSCFVRRFTHVKNLESRVLHEYLNVIVEDEATDTWTRLIVERQTEQDQVIVGRWPASKGYHENRKPEDCFYHSHAVALSSSSSSSGPAGDLPLPLATRSFQKGKFKVNQLAACEVAPDVDADSDHLPIRLLLDITTPPPQAPKHRNWKAMDAQKLCEFVAANMDPNRWSESGPQAMNTPNQINTATEHLIEIVQQAIAHSTPWARPSKWANPDWTPECSEMIKQTHRYRRIYTETHTNDD
jgi:hypothetical protein